MSMDKERRTGMRYATDLDIHFTEGDRPGDRSACVADVSSGGMRLNSNAALQPGDMIHIRCAEKTSADNLLGLEKACAAKVVYCLKRGKQDMPYGIGVRYHALGGLSGGFYVPEPDSSCTRDVAKPKGARAGHDSRPIEQSKAIDATNSVFREALTCESEEERFRMVADFSCDWEDWIAPDGKYIYVSPSFERITGYSPHQMFENHRFFGTLLHSDDKAKVERHLLNQNSRHGIRGIDFRIVDRNGETRWISRLCQAVYNSEGEWLGSRGSNRDITQQKKIEGQLRQAQKMEAIGRLAGGVAHDINNMLSVILGNAELALHEAGINPSVPAYLTEIINATKRSGEIVRQMLGFARKQIIDRKVLDLNETVEGMLPMLRRLIGKEIDIAWFPQTGLWHVMVDPLQIEQILANLCSNSQDAIKGAGTFTIETQNIVFDDKDCADDIGLAPGGYAMLAISDDGCGICQEDLDKIFDPFFTTKDIGHGTGLGLAAVYGIVKQSNGSIDVYSKQGKGTTFKIYFARYVDRSVDAQRENGGEL
ncbi:MAG: ATP-binding protein [Desulfobacteraceae bacterium]